MEFNFLIGKKISSVKRMRLSGYDDTGYLFLSFEDGSSCVVVASYGGYTGDSEDEYPTNIFICEKLNHPLQDDE